MYGLLFIINYTFCIKVVIIITPNKPFIIVSEDFILSNRYIIFEFM
jgi:hypothetical protein